MSEKNFNELGNFNRTQKKDSYKNKEKKEIWKAEVKGPTCR